MTLFDKDGHIRHYSSPEEIIREFFDARLDYYERRRQALIQVGVDSPRLWHQDICSCSNSHSVPAVRNMFFHT